jgi:hypothetical protein
MATENKGHGNNSSEGSLISRHFIADSERNYLTLRMERYGTQSTALSAA